MLAVPADSAQDAANTFIRAGVKIVFNYSEALLTVHFDVQVHTSNPAVELLLPPQLSEGTEGQQAV